VFRLGGLFFFFFQGGEAGGMGALYCSNQVMYCIK